MAAAPGQPTGEPAKETRGTSLRGYVASAFLEAAWLAVLFFGGIFVGLINRFLDWWAPHYQLHAQLSGFGTLGGKLASDGAHPPGHGVETTLFAGRYGLHPSETVDTLLSHDRARAASLPAVLYVHGGGWIAANSASLLHSVAPIARAGYDLYSVDYPLAPRARFPAPLASVLRACAWLRGHEGVESVHLFGDSAGGNLVTMAAALIRNPPLLAAFARAAGDEKLAHAGAYPRLVSVSSIYGILDQSAWRAPLPSLSWLENKVSHFVIAFAMRMYCSRDNAFNNDLTLLDLIDRVADLPPLQLACGDKDILVGSNRAACAALRARGFEVHLHEQVGERHCFFGFPPSWTSSNGAGETLKEVLGFFKAAEDKMQGAMGKRRRLEMPSVHPSPHPERWYYRGVDAEYTAAFLRSQQHHHAKRL